MKRIAIIPAFNEAGRIERVIPQVKKYVDMVIVIDDGSRDATKESARDADVYIRHPVNMGKGLALQTGFEAALQRNADIIVTIDADGQHNPQEIPKLLAALDSGYDLVVGARQMNTAMPLVFRIGNSILYATFTQLFRIDIRDTQSGFRAFRAAIYPLIKWGATGYAAETEMLAKAGRNRIRCTHVPIQTIYADRYKGTTIIDGIKIFLHMLKWRFLS